MEQVKQQNQELKQEAEAKQKEMQQSGKEEVIYQARYPGWNVVFENKKK